MKKQTRIIIWTMAYLKVLASGAMTHFVKGVSNKVSKFKRGEIINLDLVKSWGYLGEDGAAHALKEVAREEELVNHKEPIRRYHKEEKLDSYEFQRGILKYRFKLENQRVRALVETPLGQVGEESMSVVEMRNKFMKELLDYEPNPKEKTELEKVREQLKTVRDDIAKIIHKPNKTRGQKKSLAKLQKQESILKKREAEELGI